MRAAMPTRRGLMHALLAGLVLLGSGLAQAGAEGPAAPSAAASDAQTLLPEHLLGVWASAESEFESGERLIGGEALYLLPGGQLALVGAPLPVRRCADGSVCTPLIGLGGEARFDPATQRLTLRLHGSGGQAEHRIELSLEPLPPAQPAETEPAFALLLPQPNQGPGAVKRLLRRSPQVPAELAAQLLPPRTPG